jgi:hypothetical protein
MWEHAGVVWILYNCQLVVFLPGTPGITYPGTGSPWMGSKFARAAKASAQAGYPGYAEPCTAIATTMFADIRQAKLLACQGGANSFSFLGDSDSRLAR